MGSLVVVWGWMLLLTTEGKAEQGEQSIWTLVKADYGEQLLYMDVRGQHGD